MTPSEKEKLGKVRVALNLCLQEVQDYTDEYKHENGKVAIKSGEEALAILKEMMG